MTDEPAKRLLEGPLGKGVLVFGLPLALGMGLQVTFNLVDAFLVSRLGSGQASAALGAIGICDQLAALGSIISYGYTTAATTLVSHQKGAGDTLGARRVAFQSTLGVCLLGCVFAALGVIGSRWIMAEVMGVRGLVLELGSRYLRVIVGGNITIFLLLHVTSLQRAFGSSKTPILLLILSNAINLILAVLFVYGPGDAPAVFAFGPRLANALSIPRLGLVGAAWATVSARVLVLVPAIVIGVRRFGLFRRDSRGAWSFALEKELWRLAWPASTQLVVRISAMLAIQALVARYFTTNVNQTATTALGVVFRLETMALFIGLGWGSAAQTFVGQNIGAAQPQRAKRAGWLAAGYNCLMMLLLACVYAFLGRPIVEFFDSDPEVVQLAYGYMRIVGPSYVGLGISVVLGSAMQAAKVPRRPLQLDLLVLVLFMIPVAIIVAERARGSVSLYWVVACAYAAFALVYGAAYARMRFAQSPTAMQG
jgi:putative MATE family efflux protein